MFHCRRRAGRSSETQASVASRLASASTALGRLDGIASVLPNPDLFVAMYVRKEAVLKVRPALPEHAEESADAPPMEEAADEALRKRAPVVLGLMTPAARREIHLALADDPGVETESDGEGFLKRVVVRPRRRR